MVLMLIPSRNISFLFRLPISPSSRERRATETYFRSNEEEREKEYEGGKDKKNWRSRRNESFIHSNESSLVNTLRHAATT